MNVTNLWCVMRDGRVYEFDAESVVVERNGRQHDHTNREHLKHAWLLFDDADEAYAVADFIKQVTQLQKNLEAAMKESLAYGSEASVSANALVTSPHDSLIAFLSGFVKRQTDKIEEARNDEILKCLAAQGGT